MIDTTHLASARRRTLVLMLALTLGTAVVEGEFVLAEPPADEPLPDGAIARLGTRKFRHGGRVCSLAFAPDGKTLASGGADAVVRFWDVKTGRQVRVSSAFYSHIETLSFSPDGGTLAMTDSHPYGRTFLLDAATGKTRRYMENRPLPLSSTGILAAAFAPDGKALAATIPSGKVALYDATTLKQTAVLGKHDHYNVPRLAFSPDGRILASSGQDVTIRLWDVVKRKVFFVLRSEDTTAFPIIFSRDGKWLISGGGIQEKPNDHSSPWKHPTIRIWDTTTGQQIKMLRDENTHGCINSLALAPDGRTLVASCKGLLCLWDVKEGKRLRSLPGPHGHRGPICKLQFSPDGKLLAGGVGNIVALWDMTSGRLLNLDPNESVSNINSVAVSGDGRLLAAGEAGLALWDLRTRRFVRRFGDDKYEVSKVVFSPDDKMLASCSQFDRLRLWDVASGRPRHPFAANPSKDSRSTNLAFSPNGKLIAAAYFSTKQGGGPRGIRLLDAATGEERQNLTIRATIHGWFLGIGFSPDGRRLSGTTINGETYSWRKEGDQFVQQGQTFQVPFSYPVAYSPDGFLTEENRPSKSISFRDLDTGKSKRDLSRLLPIGRTLAFSRDGRYLASGPYVVRGGDGTELQDETLRVCEMASGQIVLRWRPPPHTDINALTFTPDGRTLIAGMGDTTILLWDVFSASRSAADKLPEVWNALASGNAPRAHRAVASLLAAGDEGVSFLTRRLQPIVPPDSKELARWIADLDSDEFAVRERASRALAKAGETVRPALVRARAGSPSLELRRRLDLLLEGTENRAPSVEELRVMRAVAALEYLGTPAARRLLQRLGEGAPEARLTREARAASRRLAKRDRPTTDR